VFAGGKENPDPGWRDRGLRYLQTTDEPGAQVALLQSLIPLAVKSFYHFKNLCANRITIHPLESCQGVKRLARWPTLVDVMGRLSGGRLPSLE
jgi:hypothetical protein